MNKTTALHDQGARIEELVRQLESSADPGSLAMARELVQALMELYRAGLERLTEIVARRGEPGMEILEELGRDELVGNLLAANGVHPLDLETRVARALDQLRGRLRGQGSVELIGIDAGAIQLRLRASGSGCGSSADSFRSVVEEAMYDAAPDLMQLTIEVVEEQGAAAGFVPLEKLAGYRAVNGVGV
jgi:Fe-S cluster biogenesis protein NfuA